MSDAWRYFVLQLETKSYVMAVSDSCGVEELEEVAALFKKLRHEYKDWKGFKIPMEREAKSFLDKGEDMLAFKSFLSEYNVEIHNYRLLEKVLYI